MSRTRFPEHGRFPGSLSPVRTRHFRVFVVAAALVFGVFQLPSATAASDTTPPSVPTGLAVSSSTQSSITLGWTASTDNVAVGPVVVAQRCLEGDEREHELRVHGARLWDVVHAYRGGLRHELEPVGAGSADCEYERVPW